MNNSNKKEIFAFKKCFSPARNDFELVYKTVVIVLAFYYRMFRIGSPYL